MCGQYLLSQFVETEVCSFKTSLNKEFKSQTAFICIIVKTQTGHKGQTNLKQILQNKSRWIANNQESYVSNYYVSDSDTVYRYYRSWICWKKKKIQY